MKFFDGLAISRHARNASGAVFDLRDVSAEVSIATFRNMNDHVEQGRVNGVKSGDVDYPVRNARPVRMLRLIGVLPSTLHIRFLLSYAVDAGSEKSALADHCRFADRSGILRPLSIRQPLMVTRTGNRYSGSISLDAYLPGRCGWHLEAVGFSVMNGIGPFAERWFGHVYDGPLDTPHLGDIYEGAVDEWCKKNPFPSDPKHPEECDSVSTIRTLLSVPGDLASPPDSNGQPRPSTVWIFPHTRSIEVDFHDLDVPNSAGGAR
jgi:hypothetical protein